MLSTSCLGFHFILKLSRIVAYGNIFIERRIFETTVEHVFLQFFLFVSSLIQI